MSINSLETTTEARLLPYAAGLPWLAIALVLVALPMIFTGRWHFKH